MKSFPTLAADATSRSPQVLQFPLAAFTLTELLVVIGILAILAATQLPALNRAKAPVKFTQCMNNCRQIAQASLLYKDDNNDAYAFSIKHVSRGDEGNPNCWPMMFLAYMGGKTNAQPGVYVCPSLMEPPIAGVAFQVHYQSNRPLLSDIDDLPRPTRGSQVRKPAIYWMFMETAPGGSLSIRPGGLGNPTLLYWNYPPGSPEYRRHNGGMCSAAADGHVEWLRTPPYLGDSQTVPLNFLELGDCAEGVNPASSWARDNPHNGVRVKLWSRYNQKGF